MIFGVGTDILKIERVEAAYGRFGDRFVRHLLMPEELRDFAEAKNPVRFLSMRFAAKEAIVKALGTGFAHGIWLRDTGVTADPRGRPEIIFSPRGQLVCQDFGVGSGHITLSDEGGLVVAVAILLKASSA